MREIEEQILARAPENDIGPSLERITAVMELAGDPQRTYPSIHLTGTNGKTSTSRMIDAILRESGLSTGRFTSPHLHDIRERITLSGKPIPREKFIAAYDEVAPLIEHRRRPLARVRRSPDELLRGARRTSPTPPSPTRPVDVAIIEVGLGGSWDATNVIDAQVAVVTPVDLDHTHLLGDDVVSIAEEKSGIIKADSVTVSGVQDEDVARVLIDRVEEVGGSTDRLRGQRLRRPDARGRPRRPAGLDSVASRGSMPTSSSRSTVPTRRATSPPPWRPSSPSSAAASSASTPRCSRRPARR